MQPGLWRATAFVAATLMLASSCNAKAPKASDESREIFRKITGESLLTELNLNFPLAAGCGNVFSEVRATTQGSTGVKLIGERFMTCMAVRGSEWNEAVAESAEKFKMFLSELLESPKERLVQVKTQLELIAKSTSGPLLHSVANVIRRTVHYRQLWWLGPLRKLNPVKWMRMRQHGMLIDPKTMAHKFATIYDTAKPVESRVAAFRKFLLALEAVGYDEVVSLAVNKFLKEKSVDRAQMSKRFTVVNALASMMASVRVEQDTRVDDRWMKILVELQKSQMTTNCLPGQPAKSASKSDNGEIENNMRFSKRLTDSYVASRLREGAGVVARVAPSMPRVVTSNRPNAPPQPSYSWEANLDESEKEKRDKLREERAARPLQRDLERLEQQWGIKRTSPPGIATVATNAPQSRSFTEEATAAPAKTGSTHGPNAANRNNEGFSDRLIDDVVASLLPKSISADGAPSAPHFETSSQPPYGAQDISVKQILDDFCEERLRSRQLSGRKTREILQRVYGGGKPTSQQATNSRQTHIHGGAASTVALEVTNPAKADMLQQPANNRGEASAAATRVESKKTADSGIPEPPKVKYPSVAAALSAALAEASSPWQRDRTEAPLDAKSTDDVSGSSSGPMGVPESADEEPVTEVELMPMSEFIRTTNQQGNHNHPLLRHLSKF